MDSSHFYEGSPEPENTCCTRITYPMEWFNKKGLLDSKTGIDSTIVVYKYYVKYYVKYNQVPLNWTFDP